jgi:hypothetical protein
MSETKFHTHRKSKAKLILYTNFYDVDSNRENASGINDIFTRR